MVRAWAVAGLLGCMLPACSFNLSKVPSRDQRAPDLEPREAWLLSDVASDARPDKAPSLDLPPKADAPPDTVATPDLPKPKPDTKKKQDQGSKCSFWSNWQCSGQSPATCSEGSSTWTLVCDGNHCLCKHWGSTSLCPENDSGCKGAEHAFNAGCCNP